MKLTDKNNENFKLNIKRQVKKIEPLSRMRRIICNRLSKSLYTAPHVYLSAKVNTNNLIKLRHRINEELLLSGTDKISYNTFIMKSVAHTLKDVPQINASLIDENIYYWSKINIGIAVALEEGLIVPVIKDVDTKNIEEIEKEIKNLVGKAKNGCLNIDEVSGGTFTISNLGNYGINNFTAIINPPESAILAIGRIEEVPIVEKSRLSIAPVMNTTLSIDHRIIDGAVGALFLKILVKNIENSTKQSMYLGT